MNGKQWILAAEIPAPALTLEALSGHRRVKALLGGLLPNPEMDAVFMLPKKHFICLSGLSGVGKRTLAKAFAGSAGRAGSRCFRVDAGQFEQVPEEQRTDWMQALLNLSYQDPCVFLLEPGGNESFWRAAALSWCMLSDQAKATILVTENNPDCLEDAKHIHGLLMYELQIPDEKDREAFFAADQNRMPRKTNAMGEKVPSYQLLSSESEGLTYRELTQVVHTIRLQLKERALREYQGDFLRVRDALMSGELYYTETQFREAVEMARQTHAVSEMHARAIMNQIPAAQSAQAGLQGGYGQMEMTLMNSGLMSSMPSSTSAGTAQALTEDEKAYQDLLKGLELPPDPR